MADPLTIAAVGLGATAAGSVTSTIGGLATAGANASMYKYQAGVAGINATLAKQNAAWAADTGETQSMEAGLKGKAQVAETTAIQGASGVDVNSGTAVDVRKSETEITQFDENIIRTNAMRKAYGYQVEAAKDISQVGVYQQAATQSQQAGTIGAIGSILGGASSVASKWSQASTAGVFS